MNEAAFLINLKLCKKVFEQFGILKKTNNINIYVSSYNKFSSEFRRIAQKNDYIKTFITGLEMDDYDYLLNDGSFIQYSYDKKDNDIVLRMAYYPSITSLTYEEFLKEFYDLDIEDCGAVFMSDYQQYLTEEETKLVTPLRYDYNSRKYKPLIHSSSHIHMGYEENIRIPFEKIITPTVFAKFILQYYYYENWKSKICDQDLLDYCLIKQGECYAIEQQYFSHNDKKIPYVSFNHN